MNGCGDISSNDEAAKTNCIVLFTYVLYTLQKDINSDGNQLASGELFCNSIYTSPRQPKSHFYAEPCKRQESVTVSMRTVAILNLEIRLIPRKMIFQKGISYLPELNLKLQYKEFLNLHTFSMIK